MRCSCIANDNFNFVIDYKLREEQVVFTDYSDWVTAQHNTPDNKHEVKFINADIGLEATKEININQSTLIDFCFFSPISSTNCEIDGIYKIQIDSCGKLFERTIAILPKLICGYRQLLLEPNKDQNDWDNIYKVFFGIEYIKAAAEENLANAAVEHFNIVSKILEQLNCNCK